MILPEADILIMEAGSILTAVDPLHTSIRQTIWVTDDLPDAEALRDMQEVLHAGDSNNVGTAVK